MARYIDADKMIADTQAMRAVSEAITIDGIIKYINEHATTNETAIKAIEKQIRKKPIPITRNEHSTKIIGYGCPNCHKDIVGSGFHCWNCGQAIDWSDE